MGVTPAQVIELKALMGDSSDNIPGVRGIGPKTAITLISQFHSLDGVYEAVDRLADATASQLKADGFSAKLLEKLQTDKKMAYLSKELATIDRNVPIEFKLAPCRIAEYNKQKTMDLFTQLGFKSLQYLLPKDDFELGVQKALF
jgi:DNA polymerase-1